VIVRERGAVVSRLFPGRFTAAGFALIFGVVVWTMVRTGGPEFLIVIALWLGVLTTVMVMPRQILEIDSMGIVFPLGNERSARSGPTSPNSL
jgi:hypothetical protein